VAARPFGQSPRVKQTPVQKVFRLYFNFQKNCCKALNLVKIIEKYLLVGKMQMTYQNDPKNVIYIFVSESCMFIQL
jgi:hypothetical protein